MKLFMIKFFLNSKIKNWIIESDIHFTPIEIFDKESIIERQKLYEKVSKLIWNSESIAQY